MRGIFVALLGLVAVSLLSCKKEKPASFCPGVDTLGITYRSYVAQVMQQHCTGCHGGANPSGGLRLETYEQVKQANANGKWYRSMETGFMPPSGKLDECTLAKLKKWVDDGYPE